MTCANTTQHWKSTEARTTTTPTTPDTHIHTHTERPSEDQSHQGQEDKNGNKKYNYKAIIHCILYQINFWAYGHKHSLISQPFD